MEASQLLKELKDDGWYLGDSEGPCRQYVHREGPGVITVCVRYTDELGPETIQSARNPLAESPGEDHPIEVEATSTGASAWSPLVQGCIASGKDEAEARERLERALALHRQALEGSGE